MIKSLVLCGLVVAMSTAQAATISASAVLSGSSENPPTGSPGTGFASVIYDSTAHTLFVDVVFSGLGSGTTASHIHCCALPSANAPVATTVPTFPGFPLGVTSGTYIHTLDLTMSSSFNPSFVTANGSVAGAEAALAAGLANGSTYLNIHTTQFPAGEIRGQLVPEPATGVLMFLVAFGCAALRRRT